MIRPEDVLLLGVALLAVLFFIGGAIDVFRVPVNPRRRRRRKPARRWRMRDRPGLTELLEEWLEAESLLDTPTPRTVEKPKRVVAPTAPVVRGAPVIPMTPTFSWSPAPSRESLEHAGFALGTALSHAGRQEETMEQFRWVVTRGNPSSSAVQVARRWLVSTGVLAEPGTFASSERLEQKTETTGKIKGMTEANESDAKGRPRGVRIVLRGDDESNKNIVLETRVTLGEPYEFEKVPPGNYLMTAWVSETQRIWERKVVVEPGEETVHNLTEAHRPGPPNGLPGLAREQGLSARTLSRLAKTTQAGENLTSKLHCSDIHRA